MYNPHDGLEKTTRSITYTEAKPLGNLFKIVQCFWELKTEKILDSSFHLHALPDACVNLLFDQSNTDIAGVTSLQTTYRELDLGTSFHYVGVQLLPGVWQGDSKEILDQYVDKPYQGNLPLLKTNLSLKGKVFDEQVQILNNLVEQLVLEEILSPNQMMESILNNLDTINSVGDMVKHTRLSTRQLQRSIKKISGFSPHDLLKVLRLQKSFTKNYLIYYTDQAHFIRSFKKITGYTPNAYSKKFDV